MRKLDNLSSIICLDEMNSEIEKDEVEGPADVVIKVVAERRDLHIKKDHAVKTNSVLLK